MKNGVQEGPCDVHRQCKAIHTLLRTGGDGGCAASRVKELAFKYEGGSDAFQMLPASEQLARARAARGMQADKQSVVRGLAAERRKEGGYKTRAKRWQRGGANVQLLRQVRALRARVPWQGPGVVPVR